MELKDHREEGRSEPQGRGKSRREERDDGRGKRGLPRTPKGPGAGGFPPPLFGSLVGAEGSDLKPKIREPESFPFLVQ